MYQNKNISDCLRIIICGSVDDGKSTLIGRLLYETKKVFKDQLDVFNEDNKKFGSHEHKLDFSLLCKNLSVTSQTLLSTLSLGIKIIIGPFTAKINS